MGELELTIALDLEGTLIQDQLDPRPRPGLYGFLEFLRERGVRIVIMTTVSEDLFRDIAKQLTRAGNAPAWFPNIDYVNWERPYKDLRKIPNVSLPHTLLVDDYKGYVHPDQLKHWIQIETYFDQTTDNELDRVTTELSFFSSHGG